jgi:copper chaperone
MPSIARSSISVLLASARRSIDSVVMAGVPILVATASRVGIPAEVRSRAGRKELPALTFQRIEGPDEVGPEDSSVKEPTMRLQVDGMSCQHCVSAITRAVQAVAPDAIVRVSLADGTVEVDGGVDRQALVAAIEEEGYEVRPDDVSQMSRA